MEQNTTFTFSLMHRDVTERVHNGVQFKLIAKMKIEQNVRFLPLILVHGNYGHWLDVACYHYGCLLHMYLCLKECGGEALKKNAISRVLLSSIARTY
jgi:hypothetical protein